MRGREIPGETEVANSFASEFFYALTGSSGVSLLVRVKQRRNAEKP